MLQCRLLLQTCSLIALWAAGISYLLAGQLLAAACTADTAASALDCSRQEAIRQTFLFLPVLMRSVVGVQRSPHTVVKYCKPTQSFLRQSSIQDFKRDFPPTTFFSSFLRHGPYDSTSNVAKYCAKFVVTRNVLLSMVRI